MQKSKRLSGYCGVVLAAIACAFHLTANGAEGAGPAAGQTGGVTIIGGETYLRGYLVFKTPVQLSADGTLTPCLQPADKDPKPIPDYQSPPPPADWTRPEFDDSSWDRQRGAVELPPGGATGHSQAARHTATPNSVICLRGKFRVEDPAAAQDIKVSLEYVGGAVLYVNGQELTRAHLPAGELKPDTLAEKYPDDLFCEPNGVYLQDAKKNPAGFERRYRRIDAVAIPSKWLRKGANVLSMEIHRAAISEAAVAAKRSAWPGDGMYTVPGMWPTVGLKSLTVKSESGAGVVANVLRPKGIQVWNAAPYATVTAFDYGDPGDPLPIQVAAARNSVFSGRLIVSSDQPIKGLKVSVSDLKLTGGGGALPSTSVRVSHAEPAVPGKCWTPVERFNGLSDTSPPKSRSWRPRVSRM